jgi:hypothetical protein
MRSFRSLSWSRNSRTSMEPESSLLYSQQLATGPHPEPDESSPYLQISLVLCLF